MKIEKIVYCFLAIMLLNSCISSSKIKNEDEFAKKIFDLFKNGKKNEIKNYLITKKEMIKVFNSNKEYNALTEIDKNNLADETYKRMREDALRFIDFYTDRDNAPTIALQNGILKEVASRLENGNGPPAIRIEILFSSNAKTYYLNLNTTKVDDYLKLLSWIEVKDAY